MIKNVNCNCNGIENWLSLYLCIMKEDITVDKSLLLFSLRENNNRKYLQSRAEIATASKEMLQMYKDGYSYKEIAEKYNLAENTVISRIARYRKRGELEKCQIQKI